MRRAIFAGTLLLVLLVSLRWLGPAWDHARLLYYQGRCLDHTEPAGKVVSDSANSTQIIAADWERFYQLFSPPGGKHGATVFAHEMRHEDGGRRLVVVELSGTAGSPGAPFERFDCTVIEPGGTWARPQLRGNVSWPSLFDVSRPGGLRIYAGRPDPANAAHFTFEYEYDGYRETVDGWLRADDTISLEPRDAPPRLPK